MKHAHGQVYGYWKWFEQKGYLWRIVRIGRYLLAGVDDPAKTPFGHADHFRITHW
jgi:hypothetical protein